MNTVVKLVLLPFLSVLASPVFSDEVTDAEDGFSYSSETLNYKMTPAGHVDADYTSQNGRHINLQVIVGAENDLRIYPDAPPYSLDIRISDKEGAGIAVQRGGDAFIDKSWIEKIEKTPSSLQERSQDVKELDGFANELLNQVKPELEVSSLNEFAWIIDEVVQNMRATTNASKKRVFFEKATSAPFSEIVKIRKQPLYGIIVGGVRLAEHSSLSRDAYKNGVFVSHFASCNHGACADSTTMSTKCSKTFSNRTAISTVRDQLCDFYGGIYVITGHVCNNDTRAEYLSIKNRTMGKWSSCNWPLYVYATTCE